MWSRLILLLLCLPLAFADDPCTAQARIGALGQTAGQLLVSLELSESQKREIHRLQIQVNLEAMERLPELERKRQAFVDLLLAETEEGKSISPEGLARLASLRHEQIALHEAFMQARETTLTEVLEVLTPEQHGVLDEFEPRVRLSEETRSAAGKLLTSFKAVITDYQEKGSLDLARIEMLEGDLENAAGVVYLPDWFTTRLAFVLDDLNLYGEHLATGLGKARFIDDPAMRYLDPVIEYGLRLLIQSIHMDPETELEAIFPRLSEMSRGDYYRAVLLTPLAMCMISENLSEDRE